MKNFLETTFVRILGTTLLLLTLSGCKEDFSDNEIRGVLTVNKAQYGNAMLEVNDRDSNMTRFIYPGRKIFKIDQGIRSTDIIIYESGRAKLARIVIPTNLVNVKESHSFSVEGRKIDQAWNIKAERVPKLLRKDYVGGSKSRPCIVDGQEGISGSVWEVLDSRYDYVIHFVNEVTAKDIGTFIAIGDVETVAKKINTSGSCFKKTTQIEANEAF